MKKLLVSLAVIICTSFALNGQINDISGYYAQTLNLQEASLTLNTSMTPSMMESMLLAGNPQSNPTGYRHNTQWKVGLGLLIGGSVCFGVVGISYVALACSGTLDDFFANSLIFAWTTAVVGSAGAILLVTGGIVMGTAKSNYLSAKLDLGDGRSYAQLGLTRSGNVGLSLTF